MVHSHYENLKVARNAPSEVIRAAYKALAQKHHPDLSSDPDAARVMGLINQAWEVLSNPDSRAKHDLWIKQVESAQEADAALNPRRKPSGAPDTGPTASNPPRHSRDEEAAIREALNEAASVDQKKWGRREVFLIAMMLCALFWIFFVKDERSSANQRLSSSISQQSTEDSGSASKPNPDDYFGPVMGGRTLTAPPATGKGVPTFRPEQTRPSFSSGAKSGAFDDIPNSSNATAPGSSGAAHWPSHASYLSGTPVLRRGGLSKLTIDNSDSTSNVYVKLCPVSETRCQGFRHVFIPAGSSFTMLGIAAGEYEIRYKDLRSNHAAKSEPFALHEIAGQNGTKYSNTRLTLYQVQGGNIRFTNIQPDQF